MGTHVGKQIGIPVVQIMSNLLLQGSIDTHMCTFSKVTDMDEEKNMSAKQRIHK